MRRPLVAANWKLNGSLEMVSTLVADIGVHAQSCQQVDVIIAPPYPYLQMVGEKFSGTNLSLAAQNVAMHQQGAYTGEVAAQMLVEIGCEYVIIGHSERREYYSESNECVAKKVSCAIQSNLFPIICVGESLDDRQQDRVEQVIITQLQSVIDEVGIEALQHSVIAYEPIWAIGTGQTASPQQAQAVHKMIRELIAQYSAQLAARIRIIYGGSVKPENARELMLQEDIDGGLIGGASLDALCFNQIVDAASATVADR